MTSVSSSPPKGAKLAVEALLDAGQSATSLRGFLAECARILCATNDGLCCLIELQQADVVAQVDFTAEGQQLTFWKTPLKELMDDCISAGAEQVQRFAGNKTGAGMALFALPLRTIRGSGSVALALPCRDEYQALAQIERLDALVTLIAITVESVIAAPHKPANTDSDAAAQAVRRAADFTSNIQLAMTVTNKLASRDGFEQVALGRVTGKRIKLLAVSGLDHIDRKSETIERIEQAMLESLDMGTPLVAQAAQSGTETPLPSGRLHQDWHQASHGAPVASLPLADGSGTVAVLSIVRSPKAPFNAEELLAIDKLVAPFGAALPVVERATQGLAQHFAQSLIAAPLQFFSRHQIGRRLTLLSLAAVLLWSWFGSLPYRVTATSQLAPRSVRAVGAPVDAPLASAPFAPGMRVSAGDVLATFDTSALQLEAKRLRSEIGIKAVEANLAIAEGNPVDVQLAQASLTELQANLDIVQFQIQMATIVAPMDGLVIEGDLRERIGDHFSKGEPLFRVAADDGYALELFIDEADIDQIVLQQAGHFAAFARPEVEFPITVTRVSPAAEKHQDQNAFRVEAEVVVDKPWARTGMQGVARVDIGRRRPLWIWTHQLIDHMRLKSWL